MTGWRTVVITYEGCAADLDVRLSRFPERVLHFDHVPLLVARVSPAEERDLGVSPDVVDLRPLAEDRLRLVDGIDTVLRWAVPRMTTDAMNGDGRRRGGTLEQPHAYPTLARRGDELVGWDPDFRAMTPLAWPAAVNLSLGHGYGETLDRHDPVNVATRAAARFAAVVMANWKTALSAWV
jgi:hypothetical protein